MKTLLIPIGLFICIVSHCQTIEEMQKKIYDNETQAAQLAQKQLEGYNKKDIDLFLEPYSDSVKVYTFPDVLRYTGKEKMRDLYSSMFQSMPNLHCDVVNRIVYGNTVIDREKITGLSDNIETNALVIYTIENGKISRVFFVTQI